MTYEEILNKMKQENEDIVAESPAYLLEKQQGEYTVEDYYNTPEGLRVELIDGEFIYMEAPNYAHQIAVQEISYQLMDHIKKNKGNCKVVGSPNVQLLEMDKSIFIPDLVVLCGRNKISEKGIIGAPDLIIEILSPGTKGKDVGIKKRKYKEAGVREYWMVDIDNRRITVCQFERGDLTTIYGFEDKVPVGIFSGQCVVDFKKIDKNI